MNAPFRPMLRWLGGKWKLAPEIIQHFPPHRTYCEPYAGAASVLLRKERSFAEVLNDLDSELVNLFRVLRDGAMSARLIEQVRLTPFAREELSAAYAVADDPVERARRLIVRSYMGHGANACHMDRRAGFRGRGGNRGRSPERDWANYPPALAAVVERLVGVRFEHQPASDVLAQYDAADTLFYLDPPYMHETRSAKRIQGEIYNAYTVEMTDGDHEQLLDQVVALKAMVVLSGYACPLYDQRLKSWRRVEISTHADAARPRVEVVWINPAAQLGGDLFAGRDNASAARTGGV